MCIRLCWDDNDDTILYQVFEEGWTLTAYYHSVEALEVMVRNRQQPVRVIMDMSDATTPVVHLGRGRRVNEAEAMCNVERVVLVDPGYFMPQVNCPVDVVDTRDEALRLIRNAQLSLPA
jgi:hypothetical protein